MPLLAFWLLRCLFLDAPPADPQLALEEVQYWTKACKVEGRTRSPPTLPPVAWDEFSWAGGISRLGFPLPRLKGRLPPCYLTVVLAVAFSLRRRVPSADPGLVPDDALPDAAEGLLSSAQLAAEQARHRSLVDRLRPAIDFTAVLLCGLRAARGNTPQPEPAMAGIRLGVPSPLARYQEHIPWMDLTNHRLYVWTQGCLQRRMNDVSRGRQVRCMSTTVPTTVRPEVDTGVQPSPSP